MATMIQTTEEFFQVQDGEPIELGTRMPEGVALDAEAASMEAAGPAPPEATEPPEAVEGEVDHAVIEIDARRATIVRTTEGDALARGEAAADAGGGAVVVARRIGTLEGEPLFRSVARFTAGREGPEAAEETEAPAQLDA